MQAAQLETLKTKEVYAEAVAFIARLVAAGIPLANISASNFESTRNSQMDAKGKFPGRQVVIIPLGKEANTAAWKATTGFSPRNASRLIAAAGFPPATGEAVTVIETVAKVSTTTTSATGAYVPMGYAPTLDSSNVVRNPVNREKARAALSEKFRTSSINYNAAKRNRLKAA